MPYETIDPENHLNWLCAPEYKTRTHIQRSKTDKRYLNNFCDTNGTSIEQYYEEEKQVKAEGGTTYGEKYWVQNDYCLAYWHARSLAVIKLQKQLGCIGDEWSDKYTKLLWKNGGKDHEKIIMSDPEVIRLDKANGEAYNRENPDQAIYDYKKHYSEEKAEAQTQLTLF
tara:strand:+ start:179 stop:685 length:507 start_codon:yes stop_codon:yes gene_type:complete